MLPSDKLRWWVALFVAGRLVVLATTYLIMGALCWLLVKSGHRFPSDLAFYVMWFLLILTLDCTVVSRIERRERARFGR